MTKLKLALLKRFQLSEDGFRSKFREYRAEEGETPPQFVTRLGMYFTKWIELSGVGKNYHELFDMMVKDQFLANCDKALGTYLREKPKMSLSDITVLAEHYIEAHGVGLHRQKSIKDLGSKLTKSQPRCYKSN